MSILKNCDNCEIFNENELYEECLHCRVLTKDEYDLNVFRPKEELIRQDEEKLVLAKVFKVMRECNSYYGNDIIDCITWIENEFGIKEE